jgi:hypothetical protein
MVVVGNERKREAKVFVEVGRVDFVDYMLLWSRET